MDGLFYKVIKEPLAITGLILILFWLSIGICAPIIAPPDSQFDPYMMNRISFSTVPTAPSEEALFGTTEGGYDIFYGIVWGSRTAYIIGLSTVLTTTMIGILIGGVGAYIGGIADQMAMRLVELFMSIPFLISVIVMTVVLGKGIDKIIIALIVFGWPTYARVIRSEVLQVKQEEYVKAAMLMGASRIRIFLVHILPNSINPVISLMSVNTGRIVLIASSMSFIGIGTEPGFSDWGQLLNFSRKWITGIPNAPFNYWYVYTFPAIAIFTFVLAWNLLGDGIRNASDS